MFIFAIFRCLLVAQYTLLFSQITLNQSRKVIRMLCFGDSLTFGLTSSVPHPYTEKLQQYFDDRDRSTGTRDRAVNRHIVLYNAGVAGEKVQEEMPRRLWGILRGAAVKYYWVIILGGTNDLISMPSIWAPTKKNKLKDEFAIFNAILQLHTLAHRSGAKTVAMTIPDLRCEKVGATSKIPVVLEVRLKVNERIRNFAANSAGKVLLADLDKNMLLPRAQLLCSDGVHLTAPAYDRMAEIIYDTMKDSI